MKRYLLALPAFFACLFVAAQGKINEFEKEGEMGPPFKIFQFPHDRIPRIDGDNSDWSIVPESYAIGVDSLRDDNGIHSKPDTSSLDVKVKVGWVKGLNRLYFLYEAYDDFWDFNTLGLRNDTFEVVVDGDLSGGPHIARFRPDSAVCSETESFFKFQNVHAQNYHIMTPPTSGKSWTMVWGTQEWLKYLPYANHAYKYDFKHGESGKLILEFYITPFDYASPDGPENSIETELKEGSRIGLCWAVIDYDGGDGNNGFWNLSRHHKMYGNASMERLFELKPVEPFLRDKIEADWTHRLQPGSRTVVFTDKSYGNITSWKWDFGDGCTSNEQNPVHTYEADGSTYVVTLYISGPDGESRLCKIWDVNVFLQDSAR